MRRLCGGGGCGGYVVVVVYRYIIMPLRGPTCKRVLARIQARLNFKLNPSVAIIISGHLVSEGGGTYYAFKLIYIYTNHDICEKFINLNST